MSFSLFLFGFAIVIGGVAWGMSLMHINTQYIIITCMILLGIGILAGVSQTRQKDKQS